MHPTTPVKIGLVGSHGRWRGLSKRTVKRDIDASAPTLAHGRQPQFQITNTLWALSYRKTEYLSSGKLSHSINASLPTRSLWFWQDNDGTITCRKRAPLTLVIGWHHRQEGHSVPVGRALSWGRRALKTAIHNQITWFSSRVTEKIYLLSSRNNTANNENSRKEKEEIGKYWKLRKVKHE